MATRVLDPNSRPRELRNTLPARTGAGLNDVFFWAPPCPQPVFDTTWC